MAGKLKTIDVFCGMGALSLGFERAGFQPILAMDMEPYAAKTYAANRKSTPVLLGDCTKHDPAALRAAVGDADAVIGGVPCEPFSRARPDYGKPSQTGDARRSLVGYALRLVEEFQPRVFAFENVWGAVDSAAWKRAKARARKLGYAVDVWKLNSADYGTPQARRRAFFVGARTKGELSPPPPSEKKRTAGQALEGLGEPGGKDPLHVEAHKVSPLVREALRTVKPGEQLKGHGKYRRYGVFVFRQDRPALTITANGMFVHWNLKRFITPRELARFQEIPDSYRFDCTPSKAGYLIGDAVPVGLAAAVASRLAGHMSKAAPPSAPLEPGALASLEDVLKVGYPPEEVELQEPRAAPPKLRAQADRAERADKLTLGEFFHQPKPTRPAFPEELQTVERFMSLYRERAEEWLPTHVQKKYDGARHQIHRDGDRVVVFSEDGDDNTDRLPGVVKEVLALKDKRLILDAEIERWDGRQHLPREAVAGYLNSREAADDSDLVANVVGVVWTEKDGDIHKWPAHRRMEALAGLGIKQSTMGAPDLARRLNAAPQIKAQDLAELERAVRRIRKLPGSEGVVAKQADSPYPLKSEAQDIWVKFHNASTIRGIVHGRTKTKGGVWVYQYGVLPGKAEPAETDEAGGRRIVPVGDTFATKRAFGEGDGILVEAETVNLERGPDGVRISAWVPRVIGPWDGKPDTVDSATARARGNLVLQEKKVREDGGVEYLPTRPVQKQEDPYMEVPDEERAPYPYTVHHHFRGKSLHADLRIGFRPGKLLIGWTLNNMIKGSIGEPVTTLAEARRIDREEMEDVSKIDWRTGEWARRPKAGTPKLVRTEILCERKAPEPWDWIDVEGKTREPGEGAPPVGGTRRYPGVFHIVDKGEIEFGAQKPWFHEYFVRGRGMNYRLIFRQLKLPAQKYRHARDRCMECREAPPDVDVIWAEGMARAWFCKDCFPKWKARVGESDVDHVKEVTTGEVPKEWSDVHKDAAPTAAVEKTTLPPSEPPERAMGEATWFAIQPDDPTPYVLDPEAVKKGWMPPPGVSALPRAVRSQVPAEHRYWKKKGAAAKASRDALVEAVKAGDVKLDHEAAYRARKESASMLDAEFALQEQTWRGPVQIRVGPSRTLWWLRLDIGRQRLLVMEMYLNPLDNKQLAARVGTDPHKESMEFVGPVKPGHYLNPSKETPSVIEILDAGKASVLAHSRDFLKIELKGKRLKGLYQARRNPGAEEWLWSPAQAGPETEKADTGERMEMRLEIPVMKAEKEKRLVTGIVLEPDTVDAQGDTVDADTIERAAHRFLARYNRETKMGMLHKKFSAIGIELVECWVAKESTTMEGQQVKKGSWLMTVHVTSDKVWEDVKSGKITGFSIGGTATVI